MKKFIGVLAVMMFVITSFAQDFKKVQTSIIIAQFDAAKTEYDKIIAKKPTLATTADGFYWAARIYSGLNKDAVKNPNAYAEMKKNLDAYITADPKFVVAKENGQDPFFDVYTKSFKEGVTGFNSKDWKVAAENFSNAVYYSDFIFSNGWANSKQPFDTTSLVYAGYSNQNAGNVDKTLEYYQRLINAKVKNPEYADLYRYTLVQFTNKKDKANFDKNLAAAEEAYPKESWAEYKTDYIDKSYTIDEKVKLYDEITATGKLTEVEYQMYGDMFMAGKTEDAAASEKYILKAAESYKKAFEINPNNYAVAFNIGIAFYNQFIVLDEQTSTNIKNLQNLNANKGVAPKDPKKKAAFDAAFKHSVDSLKALNVALEAPTLAKADGAIEWVTKAFNVIKDKENLVRAERNVAGRSVDFLATLYAYKRDKARSKDPKKMDEYDAQYNIYDKLHDKYNK
jgi:hypothetical protein